MEQLKPGTKISKNMFIVGLITDANEIIKLANDGKDVYVTFWKKPFPAAFILGMQFMQVVRWINNKVFYKIEKYE